MSSVSPVNERERDRARASSTELAERIARLVTRDGSVEAAPGLFLLRSAEPVGPVYTVSTPSLCVIVQGSKELFLGNDRFRYDASRYLLITAGMPVVAHIIGVSTARPYLAVRLNLDPDIVTAVLMENGLLNPRTDGAIKAMAVSRLDANLLDSVLRLVRLVGHPRDYTALAPLTAREIVYRLALGEQGRRLRQIAVIGGREHRMRRAIEVIRKGYDKPLRIAALARQLGMSTSGLHHHFKAVTAMSPLQFQKQIRLQEARRLMLAGDSDAATAGLQVGYDDASHFNREYKRFFGEPPMRDVERLRDSEAAATPRISRRATR